MPSRPGYTPQLLSLIQSTSYPSLPNLHDLESLRQTIHEHSSVLARQGGAASRDGSVDSASAQALAKAKALKKEEKRKRKEREDDRERLALEANEKAGMRLEALERARVAHTAHTAAPPGGAGAGSASSAAGGKSRAGTHTASPSGVRVKKERTSVSPAPSNASSASFRPSHLHGTPTTYGGQQFKKKKVKRVLDSDDEATSQARDRSTTLASPPPHHAHAHQSSTSGLKLKLSHTHPSHPLNQAKHRPTDPSPTPSASAVSNNIDFSLPPAPARPLVPPRPGVQRPPKPGPKKQSEVDEDYSNAKAPSQVAFPTFWSGVEPYLRDIREDDLAMLGFKADAPESYEIPPRGRHYTEIWDEEDGNAPGTTPRFPVPNLRVQQQAANGPSSGALPLPHFVPSTELRDENLVDEHRGLGSLTERVVAAVVGKFRFGSDKKDKMEEQKPEALETEQRDPAKVDVVELEERMKKELKAVMLLGEHDEFDGSNREDDEITSALRQCQRQLVQQTSLNDARRARLADIAKHRLAYTEYTSLLEGIEKSIEAAWAKRIKKYGTTPKRSNASSHSQSQSSGRPPVPDTLKRLVSTRKHWQETVGQLMKERPRGQVVGIPLESIYDGIGDDASSNDKDEERVEEAVNLDLGAEEMDMDED